jgi:response regulator of citrate/malate metabolism
VCAALRAASAPVDVIAVTSARDLSVVRAAVSSGVMQYLLKPFTFATLRGKLETYATWREQVVQPGEVGGQNDVDRMLSELRTPGQGPLPKGLSASTLESINAALADAAEGLSAAAIATAVGIARVTARRYLEYLADNGIAQRRPHYGSVGRPEVWYVLVRR